MDKKKIFIIGGVVLVLGVGFYFWNKSKNANTEGGADGSESSTDTTTKSADVTSVEASGTETIASVKPTLNTRKEKKKACGRKPILKKKKAEWQKCVDAGGVASFEGNNQWQDEYMDFEGLNLDL